MQGSMITIFWILGILAYLGVAAWTFGYVRGATDDDTGFETPIPTFASIFWPITLAIITVKAITIPLQSLGLAMQQKQVAKKKQRIELQQNTRIELEKIEKELEDEFLLLEEAEQSVAKKRTRGKRST